MYSSATSQRTYKSFILLLIGYLLILLLLVGIYSDHLGQKEAELERQKRQFAGLEYLGKLETIRMLIVEYKENSTQTHDKKRLIEAIKLHLKDFKISQPQLIDGFKRLEGELTLDGTLDELLDALWLEGFSTVNTYDTHFFEEKGSYFLSILSTYFLPELGYDTAYLKSILEYDSNGSIVESRDHALGEHIQVIQKKVQEIDHIIHILAQKDGYDELLLLASQLKTSFALIKPTGFSSQSHKFPTVNAHEYKRRLDAMSEIARRLDAKVKSHFNNQLQASESRLHYQISLYKGEFLFLFIFLTLLFSYLYMMIRSNRLKDKELLLRHKELERFNHSLQTKIHDEVQKNRLKDEQIFSQSKMAQLGEMINMMAYQWKQPLAGISAASININLKAQLGEINPEELHKQTETIASFVRSISRTIDDFRNFFKPNQEQRTTTFPTIATDVLTLMGEQLKSENITLIEEYGTHEEFENCPSELRQVVLNIINNIRDLLITQQIKEPRITIKNYESPTKHILEISGNAQGVTDEFLAHLFDPYSDTNKLQSSAALGLHVARGIIEKYCNGSLKVSNPDHSILFTIKLYKEKPKGH